MFVRPLVQLSSIVVSLPIKAGETVATRAADDILKHVMVTDPLRKTKRVRGAPDLGCKWKLPGNGCKIHFRASRRGDRTVMLVLVFFCQR